MSSGLGQPSLLLFSLTVVDVKSPSVFTLVLVILESLVQSHERSVVSLEVGYMVFLVTVLWSRLNINQYFTEVTVVGILTLQSGRLSGFFQQVVL